jgi:L-serine dehydratase
MVPLYPDFYNDVFGPIMQPGSSSHQAGPCRLGFLARSLIGGSLEAVRFSLPPDGSYAGTFGLMNEDLGLLAGVLGMLPDDPRLFDSRKIADEIGLRVEFALEPVPESGHPNAVAIGLSGPAGGGAPVRLVGDSIGGGMVEVRSIDGFPVSFKGDSEVLLAFGEAGRDAPVDRLRSALGDIFEEGEVLRPDGASLRYFKPSAPIDLEALKPLSPGLRLAVLRAVLPVLTTGARKPQLFDSMISWRRAAGIDGESLAETAIRYEMAASGWSRERVVGYMEMVERKMRRQTRAVYEEPVDLPEDPFRRRDDLLWPGYLGRSKPLAGDTIAAAIRYALAVNVKPRGVEIVPGPMGTGGGYLYSALAAVREARGFGRDDLMRGLFVAAGIGAIAYTRTEPTGEVIGCAGECGVCSAMGAAGVTEMAGGSPAAVENAASFAMQAAIGLPCDPIPGGFEQPCISRIIQAVSNAIVFSDLALSGADAVLPFHEALDAADSVGRSLSPELRCTSRGGCCATPTAKRLAAEFTAWRRPGKS